MIKLAVLGATGRMGSRVLSVLAGDARFRLVAALTRRDDPRLGRVLDTGTARGRAGVRVSDATEAAFDVLIDFSAPDGTLRWLDQCRRRGAAMVIGVTGFREADRARITDASRQIAVLQSANFSIGINVLLSLAGEVARRLGDGYDIEIVEQHHNQKADAPSGTAHALVDAVVQATGRDRRRDVIEGRSGMTGVRPAGQIGVHAVRMGGVIGRHDVYYGGASETITLSHTAHSRDAFARGALEAAAWLCGREPGLYTMKDVLK